MMDFKKAKLGCSSVLMSVLITVIVPSCAMLHCALHEAKGRFVEACLAMYRMVNGQRMEPLEEVVCEIEDEYSGPVIDALSLRRGEVSTSCEPCLNMTTSCTYFVTGSLCLAFDSHCTQQLSC